MDVNVGDLWMVDLMARSKSQLSYYNQLQTMMLMGGVQSMSTPDQAMAMILVLDKNATVEKQLQARSNPEAQHNGGGGPGSGQGKPLPKYQNQSKPTEGGGRNQKPSGNYKKRTNEEQQQFEQDRENKNCFGCHQPGNRRKNCPEEMKKRLTALAATAPSTSAAKPTSLSPRV